jgi:hypothetical protein
LLLGLPEQVARRYGHIEEAKAREIEGALQQALEAKDWQRVESMLAALKQRNS